MKPGKKLLIGLFAASLIPLSAATLLLKPDSHATLILFACNITAVLVAWRLLEEILPATYDEWRRRKGRPDKFVERLVQPVEEFIQRIRKNEHPEEDDELRQRLHRRLDGLAKRRNLLPAGGVTREVTILISDLRGFTIITENYSASEVVGVLNRYFTRMTEIITRHGGRVDKFIGDSVMALFPASVSRPNDSERAVCCAAEMQYAMDELNQGNESLGMPTIYMGIGINTGRVVAGKIGSDLYSEYTVVGKEVNLASRIESSTLRGQILISESTYLQARDLISVKDPFNVSVKGKRNPIRLYELTAVGEPYNLIVPEREIRKSLRADVNFPLQFQVCEGKTITSDYYHGRVLNISADGMLVRSATKMNQHLDIKFRVGTNILGRESDDIYGKILRVKKDNIGRYEMNVEFTVINPKDSVAIKELVNQVIDSTFRTQ